MPSYNKDELAQIHLLIPRETKDALDLLIPKGSLSHIIRRFLINYAIELIKEADKDNPFDTASKKVIDNMKAKGEPNAT